MQQAPHLGACCIYWILGMLWYWHPVRHRIETGNALALIGRAWLHNRYNPGIDCAWSRQKNTLHGGLSGRATYWLVCIRDGNQDSNSLNSSQRVSLASWRRVMSVIRLLTDWMSP
jgi:hypothetical protein